MQKELGMLQGEFSQMQTELTQLDAQIDARLKEFQEEIKTEPLKPRVRSRRSLTQINWYRMTNLQCLKTMLLETHLGIMK